MMQMTSCPHQSEELRPPAVTASPFRVPSACRPVRTPLRRPGYPLAVVSPGTRVLHVIDRLTDHGGAEVSLELMLLCMQGRGIQNIVVPLAPGSQESVERLRSAGVEVRTPIGRRGPRLTWALRREVRSTRVDIVHTSLFSADLHGRLAARSLGVPALVSLVNSQYSREAMAAAPSPSKLQVARLIDAALGRVATTAFHALTEAVAEHAIERLKIPPQRVTVIPRGRVSTQMSPDERALARQRLRSELGLAPHEPLVVNVARQEAQKGQQHLVHVARQLRASYPGGVLAVAGREGAATPRLREAAASAGDSIRFLGARQDVGDLLSAADCFVFSSLWEGQGGSVVEAMAAQLPVVAFDIGPVREVLGGHGMLVPVGDEVALADAVVATLTDRDASQKRAAAARSHFERNFDIQAVVPRMIELYQSITPH